MRLPLIQTDLCKLCPGTIQLDVNPVSYFILPDRRTYRHGSASLATDTVQLYTSCKNIHIFTDENIFDWENIKYELRGCGKFIDLTSGIYHVDSARCSPCGLLTDVVSGKKKCYYVERPDIHNDKMQRATFRFGTSKACRWSVHVNHLLFTEDT